MAENTLSTCLGDSVRERTMSSIRPPGGKVGRREGGEREREGERERGGGGGGGEGEREREREREST